MSQTVEPLIFTVPLSFKAHAIAQKHQGHQSHPLKAKQAYLNSLAVYAVDFYLRCMGFEMNVDESDSYNPIMVRFMDVADLSVKQIGKLECRPVLPNAKSCQVPPEAWSDRVGYVIVQLSQTLKQATLVGFTPTAAAEVPLTQLRSLPEFLEHLNQIRHAAIAAQPVVSPNKVAVNLRKWFEGMFETGWQTIDDALGINQANPVFVRGTTQLKTGIKRAKLIDLGVQLGLRSVALSIAVTLHGDETVSALVQAYPGPEETRLPPNLKLVMLSESGERLQEVCARGHDNYIQLRHFRGHAGDNFTIQLALNNISVTEDFVL
jgi:hypothetical protein